MGRLMILTLCCEGPVGAIRGRQAGSGRTSLLLHSFTGLAAAISGPDFLAPRLPTATCPTPTPAAMMAHDGTLVDRWGGKYQRVRRFRSNLAQRCPQVDPVTGKRAVRLIACPYAQRVLYRCVDDKQGSAWPPLGAYRWCWDCNLCNVEFDAAHLNARKHLKHVDNIQFDSYAFPDIRYFSENQAPNYHDGWHAWRTPATPGGAPRVTSVGWAVPFDADAKAGRFHMVCAADFDHVPLGFPYEGAGEDFTVPAGLQSGRADESDRRAASGMPYSSCPRLLDRAQLPTSDRACRSVSGARRPQGP